MSEATTKPGENLGAYNEEPAAEGGVVKSGLAFLRRLRNTDDQ